MSLAFVFELHRQAIAFRDGEHYVFQAAACEFISMDGQAFRSPQDAKAIQRHVVRREREEGSGDAKHTSPRRSSAGVPRRPPKAVP